jgi:hypothetical protein
MFQESLCEVEYDVEYGAIFDENDIVYRSGDHYINATKMCEVMRKKFKQWDAYHKYRSIDYECDILNMTENELIKYNKHWFMDRTVWMHPRLAVHLADWLSPGYGKFVRELNRKNRI